jgi:phosphate transport system substrate-binding protein
MRKQRYIKQKISSPSVKFGGVFSGIISIAAIALGVILFSACSARDESNAIIAGSTSVQPYAELLAEEFALAHRDYIIDIQGGGSSAGIAAAMSGAADIGMSSRALKESEKELWEVEIAKDGLAIIVNYGNPIIDLAIHQVRDIYAGKVTSWEAFGGRNARIHIIAREEGSGTRSAFEDLVMGASNEITPKAIVQDSNGAVRQLVADDPDAIGFISLGLVDSTVKAVRLDGILPTRENVINGIYTLFRPFLFVSE